MTRTRTLVGVLLPIVAAAIAYGGALQGGFVYDDHGSVYSNPLVVAGDWWGMAFGPEHTSLANRPVACLSIVLDHTLWGMSAAAFRTTSLVLHAVNALLVGAVVRGCLLAPNLRGRFTPERAAWLATFVAALWACHPLGADAVAYVTQRSTLTMSLGFLACLRAVQRAAESPTPARWRFAAVVALALGMASKEDLVVGPILVVLFERAFLVPSWRAMRDRRRFHFAIASTWLVLIGCVAAGPSNPTVGFDALVKVSPIEWLFTQASVVVHYIASVVWPTSLRTVYEWPIVRDAATAAPKGLVVLALAVLAAWQWRRRPWFGWLGALFFLLLAPTSSVMPIVTEVVADRRMYLPMLAVLVPIVLAAAAIDRVLARAAMGAAQRATAWGVVAGAALVAATLATRSHAPAFTDGSLFWRDAFTKNELKSDSLLVPSILSGYARALNDEGRGEEALALLERAIAYPARRDVVVLNYATAVRARRRFADAERELRKLLAEFPDYATAQGMLAAVLVDQFEADTARGRAAGDPRLDEAERLADRAYRKVPKPDFLNTRGMALCRLGRLEEAEFVLRLAVTQDPTPTDPWKSLGAVLLFAGKPADAIAVWRSLLPKLPSDTGLRMNLAAASLQAGDKAAAKAMVDEVLRLDPKHAAAKRLATELAPDSGR
ncbi:MAG: tetratricopeptide repeat protein [Planctomycetes bacterium]|nr:tetratricopeptide repeat protein [Planctomycetota bacterium]